MKYTTKQIGAYGENIAEEYLKKRGWRILSRNYRVNGGELDIVGFRFGVLVFFEVKTRTGDAYGLPSESVDGRKLSRIQKASRHFLNSFAYDGRISVFYPLGIEKRRHIFKKRVDVIEVYLDKTDGSTRINHIKDWENKL